MDTTHDDWARAKLAALTRRLAIQGAAELMDEALGGAEEMIDIALRAYRAAMAMGSGL